MSVRQHSGAVNVRHYVTAYYCKIIKYQKQIRCEARGCIRIKIPMRLSSAGSFLYLIELVDYNENMAKEKVAKKATRTRRSKKAAATEAAPAAEAPAVEEPKAESAE